MGQYSKSELCAVAAVATLLGCVAIAPAQQPVNIPRLGYVEGKNILIDYRSAEGKKPIAGQIRRSNLVHASGLASYGVSLNDLDRRAASYIDKLLKGAKPADLPVEQPTKFEMVINLKAAKEIGLTVPPDLLRWADEFIR